MKVDIQHLYHYFISNNNCKPMSQKNYHILYLKGINLKIFYLNYCLFYWMCSIFCCFADEKIVKFISDEFVTVFNSRAEANCCDILDLKFFSVVIGLYSQAAIFILL